MKMLVIMLSLAGLTACNDGAGSAAPSTKVVDSAAAAAPDTIKAMPVNSGSKPDSVKR
jgi:hypothetical protein